MKPHFQKEGITVYCCDCKEVINSVPDTAVCLTDPPYGISLKTDYHNRGRGKGGEKRGIGTSNAPAKANNYVLVAGDDEPFDPAHLLRFATVALFGGNYFADKLPVSSGWIVWDKLAGLTSKREFGFNDQSDCELIWTNQQKAARILPHRWNGLMKGSERDETRVHPTQKPVAVMEGLIRYLSKPGDLIFDPYIGSGSTAIAALRQNRKFIGCEISEDYCKVAVKRVEDEMGGGFIKQFNKFIKRKNRKKKPK